jgi:hypothetical protein
MDFKSFGRLRFELPRPQLGELSRVAINRALTYPTPLSPPLATNVSESTSFTRKPPMKNGSAINPNRHRGLTLNSSALIFKA